MGDIKKLKKKYTTPRHPWNATRIKLEREILRKYGVANKREIWKMESVLKGFKDQAKGLLTRTDEQANKERQQMQDRMVRLGLIPRGAGVDDILGLQLKDIMDRRLQTIVMKRQMARSIRHSRQLITHEHIIVGGRKVSSPSYLVLAEEEAMISYSPDSAYARSDHPEAFNEEIARRKLAKSKKQKGHSDAEIVLFDESELEDPEETIKESAYEAGLQDLAEGSGEDAPAEAEKPVAKEK